MTQLTLQIAKELKRNTDAYIRHGYTIQDIDKMLSDLKDAKIRIRMSIQVNERCLGLSSDETQSVNQLLLAAKEHLLSKMDTCSDTIQTIMTAEKE